jgi:hypothetical protein
LYLFKKVSDLLFFNFFKGFGALDGTSCGVNKVCNQNKCDSVTNLESLKIFKNPCSVNPCLNDATCIEIGEFYLCNCPSGYTGFILFKF